MHRVVDDVFLFSVAFSWIGQSSFQGGSIIQACVPKVSGSIVIMAWFILRLWRGVMATAYGGVVANITNKQLQTANNVWPSLKC
jgi:hypothetical protein